MKIAMIGHKTVPSREGGIEVAVEELAVRMALRGHEVVLYNRRRKGQERSAKTYKGVALKDVPTVDIKGSDVIVYSVLAAFRALFGHYDVIHFHAEGPAGMSWLTRLFGIPTVVTVHGLDWQRSKWGSLATWYIKRSEKTAVKRADRMIVLSENMQNYFENAYKRETSFIRNGITTGTRRAPSEIAKLGLRGGDYILFLARLVPEKGLHYLLDAFKGIDTDLKLVIAGRLNDTDYVNKIREKASLDGRVTFAGFVSGALLDELFSNCRAYVLPSDVEGMPLSLLEALSYGAPCIASDIEENKVAPEEYLTLFRHGDPDDLRQKLEEAINTEVPAGRLGAQTEFMREKYSWEAVVDDTLSLYEEVCRSGRGKKK